MKQRFVDTWFRVGALTTVGIAYATAAFTQTQTCGPGTSDPFCRGMIQIPGFASPIPRDPRFIAADIIKIFLGFLGIIAVAIILAGGFKWMTAMGDEEKVKKAKQLIGSGVVGLLIIVAAYAIATFVLERIWGVVTGTS
jgi:hypothetical protein